MILRLLHLCKLGFLGHYQFKNRIAIFAHWNISHLVLCTSSEVDVCFVSCVSDVLYFAPFPSHRWNPRMKKEHSGALLSHQFVREFFCSMCICWGSGSSYFTFRSNLGFQELSRQPNVPISEFVSSTTAPF